MTGWYNSSWRARFLEYRKEGDGWSHPLLLCDKTHRRRTMMSGDDRQNSPSISRQNRPSATIVCLLLSNVCVVTSFYQSLQAMSSFMHFPICATYCTLSLRSRMNTISVKFFLMFCTSVYKNMTAWCLTLQSYCTSVFTSFGRMASDIILRIRTALRQCLGCHPSESSCRPAW